MSNQAKQQALEEVYAGARKRFPGVPEISADELKQRLGDPLIVLVDVREPREQTVSMLPGAITIEEFETTAADHQGKTVVSYCTIGGRSGMFSSQLQAQGWDVMNFKGSILAWTHVGGDLQNAEGPTNKVHTHSKKFAAVVAEDYEAVW